MKCELCHQANAEAAITRIVDGEERELYVCKACALAEKRAKQKRSQRTRKNADSQAGLSVEAVRLDGNTPPPPILGALLNAVNDMVSDIENDLKKLKKTSEDPAGNPPEIPTEPCEAEAPKFKALSLRRIHGDYLIGGLLHLEGLHMIGELAAVERGVSALGLQLEPLSVDGVRAAGHAYRLLYADSPARARRVVAAIVEQEGNARKRLLTEMARLFLDGAGRALAVLKNCRLLSFGELFDLLSSIRLAVLQNMVDGLTKDECERMIDECDLSGFETKMTLEECDRLDADRADEINRRFEDVMLNDLAEEILK